MENDFFGGFEAIASHINNTTGEPGITKVPGAVGDQIKDPKDIKVKTDDPIVERPIIDEEEIEEEEIIEEEEEEIEDEIDKEIEEVIKAQETGKNKKDKGEAKVDEPISDLGEAEAEITEYVQERLFASLGLPMDEDTKLESIEDITNFIIESIEEGSIPEFANETVADIDSYVRNGGDLRHYMEAVHGGTDIETIDIDNVEHQKRVVAEDLRNQGLSELRIQRKLERMEDGGTLQEEAEDSLESLKEYKEKMAEKLLKDQENQAKVIKEQQQRYITDVESTINEIDNIRGIELSTLEKKQLFNYIFKPVDASGQTQYQKDYISNNRNLIESAYFTMKGDKLMDKVEKKANSNAAKKLKTKLANKGTRGKNQNTQTTTSASSNVWSAVSQQLKSRKF